MQSEQRNLNEFESAVLARIAQSNAWLHSVLGSLSVSSRKTTGAGSYTDFESNSASVGIPDGHFTLESLISMPGISNGMGATLFVKGGCVTFLEIYVFGGQYWDGTFNGFSLSNDA